MCVPTVVPRACHGARSYEELAVALAQDIDRLLAIRSKLEDARMTCPLFDTARWVKNFETGLRLAWSRHEMGLVPADIDIPDSKVRGACHLVPTVLCVGKVLSVVWSRCEWGGGWRRARSLGVPCAVASDC